MEKELIDLDTIINAGIECVLETEKAFYICPVAKNKYDQTMYRKDKKTGEITKESVSSCITNYDDYYDPDNCKDVTNAHALW